MNTDAIRREFFFWRSFVTQLRLVCENAWLQHIESQKKMFVQNFENWTIYFLKIMFNKVVHVKVVSLRFWWKNIKISQWKMKKWTRTIEIVLSFIRNCNVSFYIWEKRKKNLFLNKVKYYWYNLHYHLMRKTLRFTFLQLWFGSSF